MRRSIPDSKKVNPGEKKRPLPSLPGLWGPTRASRPTTQGPGERPGSRQLSPSGHREGRRARPWQAGPTVGEGGVEEGYYPEAEGSNYITNKPRAQAVN